MKKNKNGKIVNISSIAGRHRSIVSGVHYVASKSGLIGLTKQLAYEAARYNINVNAVCPSQTLTEMLSNSMNSKELKELSRNIPIKKESHRLAIRLDLFFSCVAKKHHI